MSGYTQLLLRKSRANVSSATHTGRRMLVATEVYGHSLICEYEYSGQIFADDSAFSQWVLTEAGALLVVLSQGKPHLATRSSGCGRLFPPGSWPALYCA